MKSSALYDAREHATPAQLEALEAKRRRQSSINTCAKRDGAISCPSASARVSALPDRLKRYVGGARNYKELFERAAQLHPLDSSREAEALRAAVPEIPSRAASLLAEFTDDDLQQELDRRESAYRLVPITEIHRAIVAHFNFTRRDLMSKRREAPLVRARQVGFYIAKALTQKSLPEIGRMFGGFDHTTILYAVKKIERLIKTDPATAQDVGEIINNLGCRDI